MLCFFVYMSAIIFILSLFIWQLITDLQFLAMDCTLCSATVIWVAAEILGNTEFEHCIKTTLLKRTVFVGVFYGDPVILYIRLLTESDFFSDEAASRRRRFCVFNM